MIESMRKFSYEQQAG